MSSTERFLEGMDKKVLLLQFGQEKQTKKITKYCNYTVIAKITPKHSVQNL